MKLTLSAAKVLSRRARNFGAWPQPDGRPPFGRPPLGVIRILGFAMVMMIGLGFAGTARAAMPAETFAPPLGDRLLASLKIAWGSITSGQFVYPTGPMKPGEYFNPTTGKVEGYPYGPFSR